MTRRSLCSSVVEAGRARLSKMTGLIVSVLVALGVAGCGPLSVRTAAGEIQPGVVSTSEPDGLRVLASAHAGLRLDLWSGREPFGRVLVARDADEYLNLWDVLELDAPAPPVDFRRRVVLAEVQSDDGCIDEVTGLSVSSSGDVRLLRRPLTSICIIPLVTTAHVVSVPRWRLGGGWVRYYAQDAEEARELDLGVVGRPYATAPRPSPARTGGLVGRAPAPPPGAASAVTLDDGQRVLLVRHMDGDMTAVEATVELDRGAGLFTVVSWSPSRRRLFPTGFGYLTRAWDERGRSVFGAAAPPLRTWKVRSDGAEAHILDAPAEVDDAITETPARTSATAEKAVRAFDEAEAVPLGELLAGSARRSLVCDANLVRYRDQRPALCYVEPKFPLGPCPRGEAVFVDVVQRAHPDSAQVLAGPFGVFYDGARVTRLVYLGGGVASSWLGQDDPSSAKWRNSAGTAVTALASGDAAYLGGSLSWGASLRVQPFDGVWRPLREVAVGETFAFLLRGSVLPGLGSDGAVSTVGTLGFFPQAQAWIGDRWRVPSVLGLVLPEVGWFVDTAGPDEPYLAWSWWLEWGHYGSSFGGGPSLILRGPTELDRDHVSFALTLGIRSF